MAGESPSLVVKVEANLDGLRQGMVQTQSQVDATAKSVEKLAAGFSGEKIIGQANDVTAAITKIGGASKLTADEQAYVNKILTEGITKYQTLGKEAPAAMKELATATTQTKESTGFLAGVIGGFISQLSVQTLMQFGAAIVQLGDQLQTLHDRTDLSIDELQRMREIAATSGTSMEALAHASFVLGKNLAEGKDSTVEALADLGFNMREFIALNPDARMEALAQALGKVDDPLRRDKDGVALLGRGYEELIPALKAMNDEQDRHVRMSENEVGLLSALANGWANLKTSFIPNMVAAIEAHTHIGQLIEDLQMLGLIAIKLPPIYGDAAQGVRDWNKANADWVTQTKAKVPTFEVAMQMDKEMAEAAKEKAEAEKKANQEGIELAKAYEAYLKSIDDVRKLSFDNFKKTNEEFLKEIQKRKNQVNEAVIAELEATQKLNEAYGLTASGVMKTSSAYETYIQKMHDLSVAKVDGISQTNQEALITKEYTDALYAEAVAQDKATAATAAAVPPTQAVTQSMQAQRGQIRLNIESLEEYNKAIHDFYDQFVGNSAGTPGVGSYGTTAGPAGWNMPRMRGMAEGGTAAAGTPIVVGERGPEVFVPNTAGAIVPNGPGGSITNHIYITQPLGTPQAIAAAVGAAQMSSMRASGSRFRPAGV